MVLVHPVGGGLLCYGDLIRKLPAGYPIYGLAADDALRRDDPLELVALAEHYVDRLARVRLMPRVVAGWSFGGMVSYEMARLLEARGHQCTVAVIDAVPGLAVWHEMRVPQDAGMMQSFAADLVRSADGRLEDLDIDADTWRLSSAEAMSRLCDRLEADGLRIEMSVEELLDRLRVYANAAVILRRHRPSPNGPPLHVIWANDAVADVARLWRDVTGASVSATLVVGDHYSLLRPPAIDEVARVLHETITSFRGDSSAVQEDRNGE